MSTFLGAMSLVGITVTAYVALDVLYRTARRSARKVREARGPVAAEAEVQETSASAQASAAASLDRANADLARQRAAFAEAQEAATRTAIAAAQAADGITR
jgi:hypothetical protein